MNWNGDYACPLITGFETVTAKTGIAKFVLLYFFSPLKSTPRMQVSIRVEIRLRVKKDLSYQEYFLGFSFIVRVEQNFAEINLYQHHFNMTQIKKMLDYEGSRCAQVSVVP